MLFREMIAVCEHHMEHINTMCGKNVWILNVKISGTYSYSCALKG
jgi:hypothetical protein